MLDRSSSHRWRPWLALAVMVVTLVACGDDAESGGASTTASSTTGLAAATLLQDACDRLADLGDVILAVRGAQTRQEVRAGVEEPYGSFVEAADATGDDRLIELAHRGRDRFEVYLTATDGLDAREAGDDADIALDRSIQRCIELGATTEFPEEPG